MLLGSFVIVGFSAGTVNPLYGGCVLISGLVHYFTLVAVTWMGAEALLMFQKLVIIFVRITTKFIVGVSLVCWSKHQCDHSSCISKACKYYLTEHRPLARVLVCTKYMHADHIMHYTIVYSCTTCSGCYTSHCRSGQWIRSNEWYCGSEDKFYGSNLFVSWGLFSLAS